MDLKQLRYFAKIAELGNMTRASEALCIAQPALSQQLANLEDELGVRLLERGVYGARLTAHGDYVYGQARSLMRQVEHLKSVVAREAAFPAGRVTVGMPSSMARLVGEPLVRRCVGAGQVLLEVVTYPSADLVDMVAMNRIDVALATDVAPRKGVLAEPLFREELFAVMSPRMAAGRASVSMQEVAALPMLISGAHTLARGVEEAFRRHGLAQRVVAEVGGTDMLIRLAASGLGCAVLPVSGIDPEVIAAGRIAALPISDGAITRTLALCQAEHNRPSAAALQVKDEIVALLSHASASGAWRGSRPLAA